MTLLDAHLWKPMLAASAPATDEHAAQLTSQGYVFDWKWDGVRAFAIVTDGVVRLINRNGVDITYRYPDLASAESLRNQRNVVLDGEVIVFDPATGKPAFKWAHQRDAFGPGRVTDIARWAQAYPATFVAFDVLGRNNGGATSDLRTLGLGGRLNILDDILPSNDRFLAKSLRADDGVALLQVVRAQHAEGIIAKRLTGTYRAGRRPDWLKMKPKQSITCVTIPCPKPRTCDCMGKGKRAETFGALHLAVLDIDGSPIDVGKVGSGFSDHELLTLEPFVKSGIELVVEIEYQERQPGTGVLRNPVFKGLRTDVGREAASITQFGASNGDADAA